MESHFDEEIFFNCLIGLCHILCGLCISMLLGDNFLLNEYEPSIIHQSCAKLPKWQLVKPTGAALAFNYLYVSTHVLLVLIGLGINIAIYFKQRHLESRTVSDCFAFVSRGEVKTMTKRKHSSNCTLWRFRRNVVSPLGSFLSFIASFVYNLPGFYIFLTATAVGPSVIGELHSFSFHCFYFFCLNFIESLCSPTLRGTLVNLLPWFRHEYQAVVV